MGKCLKEYAKAFQEGQNYQNRRDEADDEKPDIGKEPFESVEAVHLFHSLLLSPNEADI